jgi:hypothetical protein
MRFLYNTTYHVSVEVVNEWREWMIDTFIPIIMKENGFIEYKLLRVLSDDEAEAISFALQFSVESLEHFITYQDGSKKLNSALLQQKYGEKCLSFATLMEIHDEG